MTLALFQDHRCVRNINCKLFGILGLCSLNVVWLLYTSKRFALYDLCDYAGYAREIINCFTECFGWTYKTTTQYTDVHYLGCQDTVGTTQAAQCVYMFMCADDIPEAYNLIKDLEPTTPQEYILKGVVNAALGQEQGSVSTSLWWLTWLRKVGGLLTGESGDPLTWGRRCPVQPSTPWE